MGLVGGALLLTLSDLGLGCGSACDCPDGDVEVCGGDRADAEADGADGDADTEDRDSDGEPESGLPACGPRPDTIFGMMLVPQECWSQETHGRLIVGAEPGILFETGTVLEVGERPLMHRCPLAHGHYSLGINPGNWWYGDYDQKAAWASIRGEGGQLWDLYLVGAPWPWSLKAGKNLTIDCGIFYYWSDSTGSCHVRVDDQTEFVIVGGLVHEADPDQMMEGLQFIKGDEICETVNNCNPYRLSEIEFIYQNTRHEATFNAWSRLTWEYQVLSLGLQDNLEVTCPEAPPARWYTFMIMREGSHLTDGDGYVDGDLDIEVEQEPDSDRDREGSDSESILDYLSPACRELLAPEADLTEDRIDQARLAEAVAHPDMPFGWSMTMSRMPDPDQAFAGTCMSRYLGLLGFEEPEPPFDRFFSVVSTFTAIEAALRRAVVEEIGIGCRDPVYCDCYGRAVSECPGNPFFRTIDAFPVDLARGCYGPEREPVGCHPADAYCTDMSWHVTAPDGSCWFFTSGCIPPGWTSDVYGECTGNHVPNGRCPERR